MPDGNDNSTPAVNWQTDPDFHALPLAEKHKVLLQVDPDYKGLPPKEQAKALDIIHYGNLGQSEQTGVTGALKGMIPPPPGGGAPFLSKEFWLGKESPGIDVTRPGSVVSDITRPLPKDLPGVQNPVGAAVYRGASILSPMSAESAEEASARGDTANVATQAAVPAALTLAGPLMREPLTGQGDLYVPPSKRAPVGRGSAATLTPAEAVEFLHSPVRASLKYGAKRLFGETPTEPPAVPFSEVSKSPGPYRGPASVRKGSLKPPPPSPFEGMTSSANVSAGAPVPQGSPTPFQPISQGAMTKTAPYTEVPGITAPRATPPPSISEPQPTSLLSRGRTLVTPGAEPDLNNPVHVKMINDYQTISGPKLRELASAGDRFAAFVLRHMPRP